MGRGTRYPNPWVGAAGIVKNGSDCPGKHIQAAYKDSGQVSDRK